MAGVRKSRGGGGRQTNIPDLDLEEEVCPICFETLAKKVKGGRAVRSSYAPSKVLGGVVICDCGHGFCKGCLTQYVRIAIREGRTRLPCPADKCKVPMQENVLKMVATAADWKKHVVYNQERKITERPLTRFCPQPNCDGIAHLSKYSQASDVGRYLSVQCKTCSYEFCAHCASGPHTNKGCDQVGDKAYFTWKKRKNVKPCPGCGHHVEKISGCSAMSCSRCKTKWCWTCGEGGKRWPRQGCQCYRYGHTYAAQPITAEDICLVTLGILVAMVWAIFLFVWFTTPTGKY